ncbi:TPA: hypothetical protein M8I33_002406 [Klebsiella aerogenes]|uniref:hypothetical protein n=1 Tax=Klebsiella aerogenes TaxID=548 RepID=UPI0037EE96E1|nr:hypothetical protein [Klebsiella aerogenes]HBZ8410366.1 hypothetical protein [Klebsiella aerogenes]HCC6924528.1 hypothetical protein [Klebsiella aerogenes]HCC7709664.1 hypothetical protein [Klebsiella aerogenes]HCC7748663.1 hypothetical protein [Klebsiella aerogenes]
MKASGQLLSLIGIVLAIYSLFFMDVSVDVGDGTRVNNIGLMAQQQNYLLVAVVLFIAGIFISFTRKNKKLPEVDFSKIEYLSSEDFISEKNGKIVLNVMAIDNFSLMLLKKHGSSSINDILFMNMPLIDRLEKGLPEVIRKDFRSTLKNRLKENV